MNVFAPMSQNIMSTSNPSCKKERKIKFFLLKKKKRKHGIGVPIRRTLLQFGFQSNRRIAASAAQKPGVSLARP
jgi:hypothetical protein